MKNFRWNIPLNVDKAISTASPELWKSNRWAKQYSSEYIWSLYIMHLFPGPNKHWSRADSVCNCKHLGFSFSCGSCRSSLISMSGGRVIYRETSPFVRITHCRSLEENSVCSSVSSTWTDLSLLLRTRAWETSTPQIKLIDAWIHKLSFLRMLWDISHRSHAGVHQASGSL